MIVFLLCLILLAIIWPKALGAILGVVAGLCVWALIIGAIATGASFVMGLIG